MIPPSMLRHVGRVEAAARKLTIAPRCPLCGKGLHLVEDDGRMALLSRYGVELRLRCDGLCKRYGAVIVDAAAVAMSSDEQLDVVVKMEVDGVADEFATPDAERLLRVGVMVKVSLEGAARHAIVTGVDASNPASVSLTLRLEPLV